MPGLVGYMKIFNNTIGAEAATHLRRGRLDKEEEEESGGGAFILQSGREIVVSSTGGQSEIFDTGTINDASAVTLAPPRN